MPVVDSAMKVALLGPPGSGKGSQCVRIKERYPDLCYINPHMMLRDEINRQTPLGVASQSKLLGGETIPNETYTQLMMDRAKSAACKAGYILDGVPMDVKQAEAFVKRGEELDAVLFLNVDDETVLRRTSGRWIHPRSGRIYHETYARPKQPFIDDETGEKLVQRHDDTPAVARARLDLYRSNVTALREYFAVSAGDYNKRLMDAERAAKRAERDAKKAAEATKDKTIANAVPGADPAATPLAPIGQGDAAPVDSNAAVPVVAAAMPAVPAPVPTATSTADNASNAAAAAAAVDPPYEPTVYPKQVPILMDVDGNGSLDTVRSRIFKAIDQAVHAKRERIAKLKWFKLW
jgi:adenylate kinase